MIRGERLRMLRQRRQLSQGTLGKLIHQDGQYISKLEHGRLPGVTTTTLVRLCQVLGCSSDYLLGLVDDEEAEHAA